MELESLKEEQGDHRVLRGMKRRWRIKRSQRECSEITKVEN